jgi:Domain of unknown function (DUF5666)
MKLPPLSLSGFVRALPLRLGLGVALALVLLAGEARVGTGGTGAYSFGRIAAVQPLVVNHVRFDVAAASVVDDDGAPIGADQLQPGMTTEIDSTVVRLTPSGASASASRIRTTTELLGALAAVDRAAGVLSLLGQTVRVDASTVFDERLSGGIDALVAGQWLQVAAAYDAATGLYRASRLAPADGAVAFKLRGVVSGLDVNARVLRIGMAEFGYTGVALPPMPLGVGSYVKLQLVPGPAETARWTVTGFVSATAAPADGREGHLAGLVSSISSATRFSINGQPVDASAVALPGGGAGLVLGAAVQVEGTFQGGELIASQVEFGDSWVDSSLEYESQGMIASADPAAGTFVLRGKTIGTARGDLRIVGGTRADLTPYRRVEVHGLIAKDGRHVEATVIVFDR